MLVFQINYHFSEIGSIYYFITEKYSIKYKMKYSAFCLLALLCTITLSQTCCDINTVKVSGNAEIKVKPDFATVDIGASATQKTTLGALQSLNKKIDQIIRIIVSQGIAKKDYSTSSLSISQVYDYTNGQNILVGQRASQTLSVKIRDITSDGAAIGKLIDAASKVDGLVVNGVNFDQSDRKLGVRQARKAAYDAAKKKADEYAALSGLRLRRVIRIESLNQGYVTPFYSSAGSFAGDFKTLVPVRDVTVSESVNIWFSLLP